MPKKTTKKSSGRGMVYTPAKKCFLVSNVWVVLPVSEHWWERGHAMQILVYGKKNRTAESLSLISTKQEILLVILPCQKRTGRQKEKGDNNNNDEDDELQDLLVTNMTQTFGTLSAKKTANKLVIELVNGESDSESDLSLIHI
eukprot:3452802-Ditylum_brightwellii.AAC.1